jgi:opacity protein-like surface antigen
MRLSRGKIALFGRIVAAAVGSFLFSMAAQGQIPTSGNAFVGYSYYSAGSLAPTGTTNRQNLNGWEGSLEGKVFPFVGVVADFSGHYGSQNVPNTAGTCAIGVVCSPLSVNTHVENFLFGPRVSVGVKKFRPFAEVLVGVGHVRVNVSSPLPDNFTTPTDTSFATAVGGGLDYKIIRLIAVRFQGDYVQTRFFGATQNNLRLSTGIVLRF